MMRLIALLCVLSACHPAEEPHAKIATAVRVQAVANASEVTSTRYSASIHPATQVEVAFRVGGYVENIAKTKGVDGRLRIVQEGDHVNHGQALANVREADYQQRLDEAKAALGEAVAAKEQAQLDFDRASKLAVNHSIAEAELDGTRVRLSAAAARVEGGSARVDEARTAFTDCTLRSPIDGVILRRSLEIGALAAPGTVAFSVADLNTVKVVFGVPDTVVETLRLGSVQSITTDAMRGSEFQGRLTRIAPSADPKSRVFEVEVSIPNDQANLKAGMIAQLKLSEPTVNAVSVAVLPLAAVVRSPTKPGQFAVFVVDEVPGRPVAHVREVELGEFLGNRIPIKSGVQGGEKVVVLGAALLADGQTVQVIP